jgi:hypothetical protein
MVMHTPPLISVMLTIIVASVLPFAKDSTVVVSTAGNVMFNVANVFSTVSV